MVVVIALAAFVLIPKGQETNPQVVYSPAVSSSPEVSPPMLSPTAKSTLSAITPNAQLKNTFSINNGETKDWKTYVNNEYKIRLRYPAYIKINPPEPSLEVYEDGNIVRITHLVIDLTIQSIDAFYQPSLGRNRTISEIINSESPSWVNTVRDVVIGGKKGVETTRKWKNGLIVKTYYLPRFGNDLYTASSFFIFTYDYDANSEKVEVPTNTQILASVEFF